MSQYEIEIKSLLGEEAKAQELIKRMMECDGETCLIAENKQLNHYFEGGDLVALEERVTPYLSSDQQAALRNIIEKGSDFSVRTRQRNEEVLLVVKAALEGGSSENGVSRLEFEEPINLTLEELDNLLAEAGFIYQAKWSRERQEYKYKDINVCLDKNAGYGYLAEFETVTGEEVDLDAVRSRLLAHMDELGVEELPQDRLARMFAHYNENWRDYYGTDKVFWIE